MSHLAPTQSWGFAPDVAIRKEDGVPPRQLWGKLQQRWLWDVRHKLLQKVDVSLSAATKWQECCKTQILSRGFNMLHLTGIMTSVECAADV